MSKWTLLVALCCASLSTHASAQTTVTVGVASSVSDAPIYIAEKKGFFRDEGLDVRTETFNSAANMVAPLGAGQLDVGGGAPSAGLYNAIAREIRLKIVADKASSQPGYGVNRLLVRKALIDSGKFKTPADLRGMKVAQSGAGVSSMTTLNEIIRPYGVKYSEIQSVDLSFPQQVIALQNGAIDASLTTDPSSMLAVKSGAAVVIKADDDVIPRHQIAVLLYSEQFAETRPDVARKFMRAYLRAVRIYNDALSESRFKGPAAPEVIAILRESTSLKDAKLYEDITPVGNDPDGSVNVASLKQDLDFFREQGLVKADIDLSKVVDMSFVAAALKDLGPYKPGLASAK
jgi:NitT/TauT family transport system substrate-binding protein